MVLTIGNDAFLLEGLPETDRRLAQHDLLMFGMYCLEEVDGIVKRIDVRHIELRNGQLHRQTKIVSAFDPVAPPSEEALAYVFRSDPRGVAIVEHFRRETKPRPNWNQIWMDMLRREVNTGLLPIWKKYDPGAQ